MESGTVQVLEEDMGEILYNMNGKGFPNMTKNLDATKHKLISLTVTF